MKLVKPHPQIFLFLGDTAADLGRPFVRIQEFFESPSKLFRRRFFTVQKFKDWYRRTQSETGKFDYFTRYNGYNVPGDVFKDWAIAYAGNETEDEQSLLGMMGAMPDQFYVIGAPAMDTVTIRHEVHHAFHHLFPEYRNLMESMLDGFDIKPIFRYLKNSMYSEDVFNDEACAYLMFEDQILHRAGVSTKNLRGLRGGLLGVFKSYWDKSIRI